jgi:hypothetical protein
VPPRFAYWTILIDQKPTAFRAREREELIPTLYQLRRKNADVLMKWFARGRLWESREDEQRAWQARRTRVERKRPASAAVRGRDWRPGGNHKDPRARFKRRK